VRERRYTRKVTQQRQIVNPGGASQSNATRRSEAMSKVGALAQSHREIDPIERLEQTAFGSNRDRHCEQSGAKRSNPGERRALRDPWIAASLRSSR
jgi:hypothetical protein